MVVGWGIIGPGNHADRVIAPAFIKAANTRLAAVCSRSLERAKCFAAKHSIEAAYDSYEKMLKDERVNAVYIGTPNYLHAEQTIMAAEAGKHVLCEKPMALTAADAERMVKACEDNHVKFGIDFENRFNPAHVEAKRLVSEGVTGKISLAKAQVCYAVSGDLSSIPAFAGPEGWRVDPARSGAGALVGIGIHFIDILRYIMSDEVEEVIGACEPQASDAIDEMEYIILKFAGGARGMMVSGLRVPRSDNGIILYGSKAKTTFKAGANPTLPDEFLVEGDSTNTKYSFLATGASQVSTLLIENFNTSILEDAEPVSPGRNGLQIVKITNAILESSRTGKAVKIS